MDSGDDPELSPTVYLVEQGPNISLRTHFHRNNQFQLFVRGEGSIGKPVWTRPVRRDSSMSWSRGPCMWKNVR